MQDEVNEKTVSLCIRCGKVTANLLKAAMKKALVKMEQEKQKLKGQKQPKQDKEDKEVTHPFFYGLKNLIHACSPFLLPRLK